MKSLDYKLDTEMLDTNYTYHAPKPDQPARYTFIRQTARGLATLIMATVPVSHERSVALTKLEEVVMWANAGIARHE